MSTLALETLPDLWSLSCDPERIAVAPYLRMPGHPGSAEIRTTMHAAGRRSVAVVEINGLMSHRPAMFSDTSSMMLRNKIQGLAEDDRVKAIILRVDSSGGEVAGTRELTAVVREAGKQKRVVAHIDATAGGTAYQVAAQAKEIVATPSAMVGGLGVARVHVDQSRQLANEGLAVTLIASSEKKVEGNSFQPLTDEARAEFQRQVDAEFADQVADVAAGRRIGPAFVRHRFGQGRGFRAREARERRMVDRVKPFDALLQELTGNAGRSRNRSTVGRTTPAQIRGLIPFGTLSDIRGDDSGNRWKVMIAPGAFAEVLRDIRGGRCHCVARFADHNRRPFASTRDGTLRIWESGTGLEFLADVPVEAERLIRRTSAFVKGVSFSARAARYEKRAEAATGVDVRLVNRWASLSDITLTSNPAFPGTRWEFDR